MLEVGIYDAKTRLSELIDRVEAGESIIITRHGEEVAQLVPFAGKNGKTSFARALSRWRKSREGLSLGDLKVRDLIDEGRR